MRMQKTIGLSLALLFVSATAWAKQVHSAHHHHHQPAPNLKAKHTRAASATRAVGHRHRTGGTPAAHSERRRGGHGRHHAARLPPPDEYIGTVQVIGRREVGSAAWYGGRHLGRRTASGERLDAVHVTAAHRSLPLHSLVRVTNLRNGRSVIATINDRGPVSRSLVIDLSPRAAEELRMKTAGIAPVSVEPVARLARPSP